jgi:hypothetical protein
MPDTRQHQTPEKEVMLGAFRAKRATPLHDGFELDPEMILFAKDQGQDPVSEFGAFCDHHRAIGSTFKDWKAAWRTWVRKAKRFNQGGKSNGASRSGITLSRLTRSDASQRTQLSTEFLAASKLQLTKLARHFRRDLDEMELLTYVWAFGICHQKLLRAPVRERSRP